jgi:ABC-2 type transport system permease protein
MIPIFLKEFNGFLNSLMAYIVIAVFLTAMGLLMWVFPDTSVLDYGYADMEQLFSLGPYVLIFLVPAITMRSLAEEKKMGTLEVLLTKPLSDWSIVWGKFLACFSLVALALLPTLFYYFSIAALGNPPNNIDTPGIIGSYIGLLLLSAIFCAVGLWASSITPNQIVSFLVAAFFCFIFYTGFESASSLFLQGDVALAFRQFGIIYHYDTLSKGLVDSRDILYFASVIVLLLLFAKTSLSSRTW